MLPNVFWDELVHVSEISYHAPLGEETLMQWAW